MPRNGVPLALRTATSERREEGDSRAARCGIRGAGGRFGAVSSTGKGGGVRLTAGFGAGATDEGAAPPPGAEFPGNAPTKSPGSPISASADLNFNFPLSEANGFRETSTSGRAGPLADGDDITTSGTVAEGGAPGAVKLEEAGEPSSAAVAMRGLRRIGEARATSSAVGTVAAGTAGTEGGIVAAGSGSADGSPDDSSARGAWAVPSAFKRGRSRTFIVCGAGPSSAGPFAEVEGSALDTFAPASAFASGSPALRRGLRRSEGDGG